jgi:rSAM/selenodomain-associated transferase 1
MMDAGGERTRMASGGLGVQSVMSTRNGAASVVAIMAKAPRAGEVKTRLCPPLAPDEAADLYRAFLLDKIEQVRSLDTARPAIAYAPAEARVFFETVAPGFTLIPQRGRDLGARLAAAFEELLVGGAPGALLIDSDTPTLPRELLETALRLITGPDTDVVLGPSEDGGYYLIGLRTPRPELFADMAWSTRAVLPETIRRARALGLRLASLAPWFDVDTGDDVERLDAALAASTGPEPRHTRRFFAGRRASIRAAS